MNLKITPRFLFLMMALATLLNFSCRKIDLKPVEAAVELSPANDATTQFFNAHPSSNRTVKAIQQKIFNQNNQKPFVEKFVKYAGFPVWNKAIVKNASTKMVSTSTLRDDANSMAQVVYIPLALDSQQNVNSILKASITSTDTVLSMLYHWQYKKYGYGESDTSNNANETALLFMGFENYVFGHSEFKINDRLLFKKNDTSGRTSKIKISSFNEPGVNQVAIAMSVMVCYIATLPPIAGCPPGDPCPEQMTCEEYDIWVENGSWGSGGSGDESNGGSGGNDGGGWEENPCDGPNVPSSRVEPCDGEEPGWEPLTEDQDRDANGYLYSRITELQTILQDFPQALEPCDSLNIMPFEKYGPMWQHVAQHTAPQSVINRIDSIRNITSGWEVDDYNIQSLSDAYGAIVNCDYFPIRITQMPPGMTPEYLLEFFRTNINSFIDPNLGMSFGPYNGAGFNDSQRFNAPYDASVGSLWHLDLGPAPGLDGSVVESGYEHIVDGGYQSHYFTVTTMETPLDFEHPVAGNRRWGIFSDPNHPGEFNFYTMGVDRIWDFYFSSGNSVIEYFTKKDGFDDADELWSSLQSKMIQFIKDNGGSATNYSKSKIVARPKWNQVERYLKGEIDFVALKIMLGC